MKLEIDKEKYESMLNKFKLECKKHVSKKQHDVYFSPETPSFFGGNIDDECIKIRIQKINIYFVIKKYILEKMKMIYI